VSNQRAQDAVQLLSLAVLLSSTFVFNQMGPIDEAALDRLSLVMQITKHVRVRATAPAAGDGVCVCSTGTLRATGCVLCLPQPTQPQHHHHTAAAAAAATLTDDAHELRSFTPSFLWLLRDFYLDLEEEGHRVRSRRRAAVAGVWGWLWGWLCVCVCLCAACLRTCTGL
jgi:hypothetical protein